MQVGQVDGKVDDLSEGLHQVKADVNGNYNLLPQGDPNGGLTKID